MQVYMEWTIEHTLIEAKQVGGKLRIVISVTQDSDVRHRNNW